MQFYTTAIAAFLASRVMAVEYLIQGDIAPNVPADVDMSELCPKTEYSPQCCSYGLMAEWHLDCAPAPDRPQSLTAFHQSCVAIGKHARCCTAVTGLPYPIDPFTRCQPPPVSPSFVSRTHRFITSFLPYNIDPLRAHLSDCRADFRDIIRGMIHNIRSYEYSLFRRRSSSSPDNVGHRGARPDRSRPPRRLFNAIRSRRAGRLRRARAEWVAHVKAIRVVKARVREEATRPIKEALVRDRRRVRRHVHKRE